MAGSVAPVLQAEPRGQGEHSAAEARPVALLKVPAWQGSGALLPSSQYEPASQSKHTVWPFSFMNLPATRSTHSFWRAMGCTVPATHAVSAVAPSGHTLPAGQSWQPSLGRWSPLSLPKEPAARALTPPLLPGNGRRAGTFLRCAPRHFLISVRPRLVALCQARHVGKAASAAPLGASVSARTVPSARGTCHSRRRRMNSTPRGREGARQAHPAGMGTLEPGGQ